jgi:hypothetical protein
MAEFPADLQSFRPSFPVLDIDPNMDIINQYAGLNPCVLETSNLDFQSFMPFSNHNVFTHQAPEFTANLAENIPTTFHEFNQNVEPVDQHINVAAENEFYESKKRKTMDLAESSSGTSSPTVSEDVIQKKKKKVMIIFTYYIAQLGFVFAFLASWVILFCMFAELRKRKESEKQ